jgi:hypothetical protein
MVYGNVIQTLSLIVEILILVYVVKEFRHVTKEVREIREAPSHTVYGTTDDLNVGDRVFVLEPRPGVPREQWLYGQMVYVIREVDRLRNRALATPVLAPVQGPTPTVQGPVSGPLSPFKKASVPG